MSEPEKALRPAPSSPPPVLSPVIWIRGAGEMASAIACRLKGARMERILMLERDQPLCVRRWVAFAPAMTEGHAEVEGITARRISEPDAVLTAWAQGDIAVAHHELAAHSLMPRPQVLVDAILAKRNVATRITDAPWVIALGPGFVASKDCHVVIETHRGHDLGRLIRDGTAAPNTGIPGPIGGYTAERVLRAPAKGIFQAHYDIGDHVTAGTVIGSVGDKPVVAAIAGVIRGLIQPGSRVWQGLKIGDIDPRGERAYCTTISDKARALAGAVLEAVLMGVNRQAES